MGDLEREMLLGYLMNALEDGEIAHVERELLRQPKLRSELALLQKELTSVYDSVDPPPHLTRRTCDKIWSQVEREERHGHLIDAVAVPEPIISLTIPGSCFDNKFNNKRENKREESSIPKHSAALEEIFAVSPQVSQPTSTDRLLTDHSGQKRLIRRASRSSYSNNSNHRSNISNPAPIAPPTHSSSMNSSKSMKKSRMFDIVASVAVGILIAVVAFPAINYAKNRTEKYFAWNAIHKINKNVDQYTQIQRGDSEEFLAEQQQPSSSVNLAQSGWQELKPIQLPALIISDNNTTFNFAPVESYPNLLKTVSMNSTANTVKAAPSQGRDIILGQVSSTETALEDVPLDPREFTDQTLMSNVDHVVPVIGGSTLQTAYGQNVLFQNGRIFIRILPVFAPGK